MSIDLATHGARRDHEVFAEVRHVYPDWQECGHGKKLINVKAYWSDDAPFQVTLGRVNSTQWFERTVHADGTAAVTSSGEVMTQCFGRHSQCPKCLSIDTLSTKMEAWGDATTCTTEGCDYSNWRSIGD